MKVLATLACLHVDDLDNALPALRELTGADVTTRFPYKGLEVARIADFLVLAGTEAMGAPFSLVQSTVVVDDLDGLEALIAAHGGEILSGPNQIPTGRNAIVRHPGGAVLEYVEFAAA